jgi:hypothetical protein
MLSTTARRGLAALTVFILCGGSLQAQSIIQQFPDGAAVEVNKNGASRRGFVRGYAAWGEYSVEYDDGRREWVPAAQVRSVAASAPAAAPNGPPDFAPLYQALGAACGGAACCIVPIGAVFIVVALSRRRRQ